MSRWIEAFEGENNRISMMRCMVFLSFFPATYMAVSIKSTEALITYLGAYVGGVIGGKGVDVLGRKQNAISTVTKKLKP